MAKREKWDLPKAKQEEFIKLLTPELASLRAKAGVSQGDLAQLIGVSRQTYSAIECKVREMTWNTYLALLMFYDNNDSTHAMLRNLGVFPDELIKLFNAGNDISDSNAQGIAGIPDSITGELDEAAFQAIRTAVMLEYARCTDMTGEAVIKAFDGVTFAKSSENAQATKALKAIRKSKEYE